MTVLFGSSQAHREANGDPSPVRARRSVRVLTLPIRAYQWVSAGRPPVCRHLPSCSEYAVEALETHGAARGAWLSLRRLGRCHPWAESRYDPVPLPRERFLRA